MAFKDLKNKMTNINVDALKNVDIKKTVKAGGNIINGMANTIQTTSREDMKKGLVDMAQNSGKAVTNFMKNAAQTDKDVKEALKEKDENTKTISVEKSLLITYCMMAADSTIHI